MVVITVRNLILRELPTTKIPGKLIEINLDARGQIGGDNMILLGAVSSDRELTCQRPAFRER